MQTSRFCRRRAACFNNNEAAARRAEREEAMDTQLSAVEAMAAMENDSGHDPRPAEGPDDAGTLIGHVKDDDRVFMIRLADTEEGRNSASMLISKMYASRGYNVGKMEKDPHRITIAASDHGVVVGTVTLGLDSEKGILADENFKDHADLYRARGARLCEITKLAFDPQVKSKMALASLLHILFIYARYVYECTDVLVEVNPRHRRFYQTMLDFTDQAEMRHNSRVDAPAYLMWLSVDHMAAQIERMGGTSSHPGTERSLYPYFFSKREERGLAARITGPA